MSLASGQLNINIGQPNNPTGSDSLYAAFTKIQDNFTNVFTEASSFTTANVQTGTGLANSVAGGTVTLVNTGVVSLAIDGTNLTKNSGNGAVILGLADTLDGLASVSTQSLMVSTNIVTSTLVASSTLQAGSITTAGNITAGNIAATSATATQVLRLTPTAQPPIAPTQGTIYYDSFINMLRVYNGTSWGNVALV